MVQCSSGFHWLSFLFSAKDCLFPLYFDSQPEILQKNIIALFKLSALRVSSEEKGYHVNMVYRRLQASVTGGDLAIRVL